MYDYILVGQGIAGSLLSWFLMQHNQKVLVIDKFNPSSASKIASGIIKPITGRRFVKTWLADELLPFSLDVYRNFEAFFNERFFYPATFTKLFDSVKEQNDWSARCESDDYKPYLTNSNLVYLDKEKVKNNFGGFEINGGYRLEPEKFLMLYRAYLQSKNALIDEEFSFADLTVTDTVVTYKDHQAQKIIFCEGANAIHNPYFKFLPFQLAKGECLYLDIKDFYPDKILNSEIILMPLPEKDRYYLGATHEWHFDDDQPTEKGRNELMGNLNATINVPVEIKDHKGAIRPTVKDRRPFMGFHPDFANVGIFNGMGTKGISLAPYFGKHFTESMLNQTPLMKEVDIKRFLK